MSPDPDDLQPAPPAEPANAFAAEFLTRLDGHDEPREALAAELAGPWAVRPLAGGFGVFRQWETPAAGDLPRAVFRDRALAQLSAALLPGIGYGGLFDLAAERGPAGFAVYEQDATCGHLQHFDEALVAALNLAVALVRSPHALALLLTAAGPTALRLTGRALESALAPAEPG